VQLEWDHGRWIVHNWKTIETFPLGRAWIQPEENLLSALIRPPSRDEGVALAYLAEANLALKKKQDNYGLQHRTHQNNHRQEQATTRQEWPHPNTDIMVGYLHKMKWRTPFLRRLRSLSRQWKMAIDSLDCTIFDFSACCQSGSGIQPRNSFRLGLIRDGHLICHNRKAYERLKWDDALMSGDHTHDRGIGPSGAQMLNNLQLIPPALLIISPLRASLVHLNINGCQSINKSAIDTLLRLTHRNLPKLQRIHMEGLRLELCQQAAKSFLREKLDKLDSLGQWEPSH